jgi:hypothetical protein
MPPSTYSAWKRLKSYPIEVKVTLAMYAICFLIGTSTHLIATWNGWWLPHHPAINTYWSSLTVLDPLVVVLLLRSPRSGLVLALAIMLSDVAINSIVTYFYLDSSGRYAVDYHVQLQTAFLGYVLGSTPFLWSRLRGE